MTSRDYYLMPYIDELLNKLYKSQCFAKINLSSWNYQLCIYLDDYYKIAFITPDSHYKWRVMPFRLANYYTYRISNILLQGKLSD
jgi:hypothetical protein